MIILKMFKYHFFYWFQWNVFSINAWDDRILVPIIFAPPIAPVVPFGVFNQCNCMVLKVCITVVFATGNC